jgi:hypothetical protein
MTCLIFGLALHKPRESGHAEVAVGHQALGLVFDTPSERSDRSGADRMSAPHEKSGQLAPYPKSRKEERDVGIRDFH